MKIIFLLLIFVQSSSSNLVLTYPQARFPPLDFLPAEITAAPCGVPKPMKTFYTNFNIGETYNVTWITPTSSSNSTYRIRLVDSDGLTVEKVPETIDEQSGRSSYQLVKLSSPCEQCMLVVEQITASGKVFKTCADINVIRKGALPAEPCNQRGTLMANNSTCQCESGYTGDKCQHYAHCSVDEDCLNGGKCVEQPDSLIRNKCFCSYGYFGQRCDQKFNSQNDLCFAYDELSMSDFPRHGMFNPQCYVKHDLSADDQLYSRRVDNEIELIMDFKTTSWLSLGWRPTQLSTSCRLFPILEDTRGRSGDVEDEMDDNSRRHFVAKPVMPKNNGFTDMGLKAPLHAMDCVDMIMASIVNGRIFISDYYSRDRSTPLEDYWYEGEMSLTAAYGIEVDGRTLIMFRRDIREIEPTDHPLGPNDLFVLWAKGKNIFGDDFTYHGTNRGIEQLNLSEVVNLTFIDPSTPISNDVAFGVKNHVHDHMVPMSTPTSSSTPSPPPEDDSEYPTDSGSSHFTFHLLAILYSLFLVL